MTLPNEHFQDFPIDFKQINPEDFPNSITSEKIIITPNDSGYISEALNLNIDIAEKNTVVINAAVGQGKTTAILEVLKKFYHETDYLIFIASPFVSLVEQYFVATTKLGIPEDEIYRYELIGNKFSQDAYNCRIQIVTVNCLLGNPGDDSIQSSKEKRNYINYLSKKCKDDGKKVVFIYDEIHDAIHNFKQNFVFNLWKWKDTIHKNFILSATYNEASKTVIDYLSELTLDKIQIIESARVRFPEKQSGLFLHFNHSKNYTNDTDDLVNLVDQLIREDKNIDILSFSKILADKICENKVRGVGKLLFDKYGDVNNCTTDLSTNTPTDSSQFTRYSNTNRYKNEKCNVGTNFKSGVSIEKENHAFIIILPSSGRKLPFKNKYGIFSDGVNSVIQALARQRVKGEIHILLPKPDKFDYASLDFQDCNLSDYFKDFYLLHQNIRSNDEKLVKYFSFNQQGDLLNDFFNNEILKNIEDEVNFVNDLDRIDKPSLSFPTYKDFRLSDGERYFPKEHKFFGGDLSSFVLYCAITNQFVNCNLKKTNNKPVLFFKENGIQWKFNNYLEEYLDIDYYNNLVNMTSDKYMYFEFKNKLFSQHKILFYNTNNDYTEIQVNQNKTFEQQLIAFTQYFLYPKNVTFRNRFNNGGFLKDDNYSRGEYFLSCITHALDIDSDQSNELIQAYLSLNYFRIKTIELRRYTGRNNLVKFLPNDIPTDFLNDQEKVRFREMITSLLEFDYFISKEIFDFKRSFIRTDYDEENRIKAFYNYLKIDFFDGRSKKINNQSISGNFFIIYDIKIIPDKNQVLNFITDHNLIIDESHFSEFKIDENGKYVITNTNSKM